MSYGALIVIRVGLGDEYLVCIKLITEMNKCVKYISKVYKFIR